MPVSTSHYKPFPSINKDLGAPSYSFQSGNTDLQTIRTFEEKIDLLIREKLAVEKLNEKICCILPNSELKTVVHDMIRTEGEIE